MIDLLLRGAMVVDGSGRQARRTDVAIQGTRILHVGATDEPARRTVDCTGLVVTPGFVDIHTHYDSQVLWDPTASPSLVHGTTTVVGGNCGFSIAPLRQGDDYLLRLMARVEGMPLTALESGPAWDWTGFDGFLEAVNGALAVNAGFLVGHSAVRRAVLGDEVHRAEVTEGELRAMQEQVRRAIRAGAIGFSTSRSSTHVDGDGLPVPSRCATAEEVLALAAVVAEHAGANLQTIPDSIIAMSDEEAELMVRMSEVGRAGVNWNLLKVSARHPDHHAAQLRASDQARARGANVVALVLPQLNRLYVTLAGGFLFDALPGWGEVMRLKLGPRIDALRDMSVRAALREGAQQVQGRYKHGSLGMLASWSDLELAATSVPAMQAWIGRTIGDAAAALRADPFDLLLDVAVGERLETGFMVAPIDDDDESWALRAAAWRDDRTVVGGSDAGAHVDLMCGATYTTSLLADALRGRQLLTIEEAVRQLATVPAQLYGLRGRGAIAAGMAADLVVLDPNRVAPDGVRMVEDLPGGAKRLVAASIGIEHVFVNGTEVVRHGHSLDGKPGRLLRL